MKVIKKINNLDEANIIVGFLTSHGIDAQVLDGAVNSVLPMPGGVRIAVADDQEAEARTLLHNAQNGGAEIEE